ncbi:MAG: class I SAM-dependent methyltransferase [Xanthomonadales bacterium]|nr:class I SAM-dependent methyltransferase [Xanthomonadales bacterium]
MNCAQAILSLFLLSPCDNGGRGHEAIEAAVAHPRRPEADTVRDKARKPAAVLEFLSLRPGMTVLDVFAGGGYYTEILDTLVGEDGRVLSHNNQAYLGFIGPQLEQRFANGRLANTEQLIAEANDIELEDSSLDAALMILAYHDFFYGSEQFNWPDVDEVAFLDTLCSAMKQGAILGVADHVAPAEGETSDVAFRLHRISPRKVVDDMTGACFDLVAESNLLRNSSDDHSVPSIAPEMSGKTDRFLYKFVRR